MINPKQKIFCLAFKPKYALFLNYNAYFQPFHISNLNNRLDRLGNDGPQLGDDLLLNQRVHVCVVTTPVGVFISVDEAT